jgi:hypothetical protein
MVPWLTDYEAGHRSPLEKTMEADIPIWPKPGHFYFALTEVTATCRGTKPWGLVCGRYSESAENPASSTVI